MRGIDLPTCLVVDHWFRSHFGAFQYPSEGPWIGFGVAGGHRARPKKFDSHTSKLDEGPNPARHRHECY
jgi:hypothetical protein